MSESQAVSDRRSALGKARLEQRDFLLKSLDDLEEEFDAGDLDVDDYRSLKADYTKRAADLIRKIEAQQAAEQAAPGRSWGRVAAWVAGVVVVAGFAGFLLAQFSGSRSPGGTITGDIRVSSRELLFEAQQTFGGGDLPGAVKIYDQVLEMQPSNVEALTYKGWLTRLQGDPDAARLLLDDAVATDPSYPDARVFSAVVAMDLGEPQVADSHLKVFDTLDAPPFVSQLVDSMGLRDRVAAALSGESSAGPSAADLVAAQKAALDKVAPILMVDNPPPFPDTGLTVTEVLNAAEALASDSQLIDAVKLVDQILVDVPDNVEALAGRGWLIARTQNAELVDAGIVYLDRALELQPDYATALVYRAFSRQFVGDTEGAKADLATFDSLDQKPADLVALIDQSGLRQSIG